MYLGNTASSLDTTNQPGMVAQSGMPDEPEITQSQPPAAGKPGKPEVTWKPPSGRFPMFESTGSDAKPCIEAPPEKKPVAITTFTERVPFFGGTFRLGKVT